MNKILTSCFLITNFLILVVAVVYIKIAIIDTPQIKVFIKWIPAFLLFMQALYLSIYYWKISDKKSAKYCAILSICYILCIAGDIFLAQPQNYMFLLGMLVFLLFYVVFGSIRIVEVQQFFRNDDALEGFNCIRLCKNKMAMALIIILSLAVSGLSFAYLILQVLHNNQYDHPLFIFATTVYFMAMLYASNTHLIVLFVYQRTKYYLAYIGIILFMLSDFMVLLHDLKYNYVAIECIYMGIYWFSLMIIGSTCYFRESVVAYLPW